MINFLQKGLELNACIFTDKSLYNLNAKKVVCLKKCTFWASEY